jgi:hypothetical protein
VSHVQGLPGELIDRLVSLLNSDALGEGEWYNVAEYVVLFIGGVILQDVVADNGREPKPGSVGEWMGQQHEVVDRSRYFELIRDRLYELAGYGMDEPFLVQSVRDGVRRELESGAKLDEADRHPAETREGLEDALRDPAKLAELHTRPADRYPEARTFSEDEFVALMRKMAEAEVLRPVSADDAKDAWVRLSNWDDQANLFLPDDIFMEWRRLLVDRLRRRQPPPA